MSRTIDVTMTLSARMPVWPGDPPVAFHPLDRIAAGAVSNVTQLTMPTHCGTHVDPPRHFIDDGPTLDQIPIERWIGPCWVAEFSDAIDRIEPDDLEDAGIPASSSRLLLKTRNHLLWTRDPHAFHTDYVALSPNAATWIVDRGIELVGIDYLSIECWDDVENVTHRTLLGNDVLVIEGLDLSAVEPGAYTVICLPLKVEAGDGAPARVVLTTP